MDEVIIPPVHSREKQKKLEEGFLKAEELPAFEEHEFKNAGEKRGEQRKPSEKVWHEQLPYEAVHKVIRGTCIIAMLAWFVLVILLGLAIGTTNTVIGLSPVLLTIIITYILIDRYHLESGFIMVFPFIFTGIFLVLGQANLLPMGWDDAWGLFGVNIIFGLVFDIVIIVHYSILRRQRKVKAKEEKKEEKKEEIKEVKKEEKTLMVRLDDDEGLKSFVSSIEDKSKALNAVIGRVYSVNHGGAEGLRKKIRINAEDYNEINELKARPHEKRRILAIELLRKIKDKLDTLAKPEREVFTKAEMQQLINLEREPNGFDKVLDVLIRNDKDPVKQYYDGAVEFCDNALDELVANELEAMKQKAAERKHRKIERAKKAIEEAKKKD